jgi:hypothetical protein
MSKASTLPTPPSGWIDVNEACSTPVGRTRLLLCKTPLSDTRWSVPAARAFTPQIMMQQQRAKGRRVKYLIQLSVKPTASAGAVHDADRSPFVDQAQLRGSGCSFVNLPVELNPAASGPDVAKLDPRARPCPISENSIRQFITLLRGFLAAIEAEEEKANSAASAAGGAAAAAASSSQLPAYVAISDVYGYNLPAFLLCCFLVDAYGMDVTRALEEVGDARPPGIYVAALLQALLVRCYEPDEEAMQGGMQAAAASGMPGNKAIARLTCIPLVPDLPRPDWHQLPWTWSGAATPASATATTIAPAGASAAAAALPAGGGCPADLAAAAAAAAAAASATAPGEEFKRKIRKKAPAGPAPVLIAPSVTAAAAPSMMAAAPATAGIAAAPKRPLPTTSFDDQAAKRAKPTPSAVPVPVANGRRSPQPLAAATTHAAAASNGRRSPQPLYSANAASAAAAAAAPSSVAAAVPAASAQPSMSPTALASAVRRDHPFLVPVRSDKVASLHATLAQLMPAASTAKFRLPSGATDPFAFLQTPPLTPEVLQHVYTGPASSRAPYLLSWLPEHYPCLLLVLREGVYALFGSAAELCFFVPNLSFPKRKLPADRVNNTLLLGELIRDPVAPAASSADAATPTTSNMQSRLLVTDLLIMSQTLLLTLMPLEQRLSTLEAELIQPLKALQATLPATAHSEMHVRAKAHFALAKAESVLRMAVPHVHQGLTLRMSGKDKDAAKSVGFQFTWRKDAPGNVSEADILKFAAAFKK